MLYLTRSQGGFFICAKAGFFFAPEHWREGQELIVEGCEPSDDPEDIKKWYAELVALSAQIPAEDHKRIAAALAEQDRQEKERMRREMGL